MSWLEISALVVVAVVVVVGATIFLPWQMSGSR